MKHLLAAIVGISVLAFPLAAAAQSHRAGSGGGLHGGGAADAATRSGGSGRGEFGRGDRARGDGGRGDGVRSGGYGRGYDHGGYDGGRRGYYPRYGGYGGYPYLSGGSGLGYAFGLSSSDLWLYDAPYYGYYSDVGPGVSYSYSRSYDDGEAAPPLPGSPQAAGFPQARADVQAPAACGSWLWDAPASTYHWMPC